MSTQFPSTKIDALTILYLQNQDLTNISPEELVKLYDDTHERINAVVSQKVNAHFKSADFSI